MKKHNINYEAQEQLPNGNWTTATPRPLYIRGGFLWRKWHYKCECGEVFKQEAEYDRHYALAIRQDKGSDRTDRKPK